MAPENKIVNGLWIGNSLSALEFLTIKSFLDKGHIFYFWTYDKIEIPPWENLIIKDADTIIERSRIFSYTEGNQFGHGKGSLAGFSDLFRYKLLYERGGWWVDMDITCLKPLNIESPYFFRNHDVLPVVGNLMKCPPQSALMKYCYEQANQQLSAENRDWMKPIKILNEGVAKYELQQYIYPNLTNPDRWEDVDYYRLYKGKTSHYIAFHWMNEEWRSRGIDKNRVNKGSFLAFLMKRHQIEVKMVCAFTKIRYFWIILRKIAVASTSHKQRQFIKRILYNFGLKV